MIYQFDREAELQSENTLTKTIHHNKVVPPTSKRYEKIAQLWKTYNSHMGRSPESCLQPYRPLPDSGVFKNFFKWLTNTRVGMFSTRPTQNTIKNMWYSFRAAFQRETHVLIDEAYGKDILSYIVSLELPTDHRHKQIASAEDMRWCLTYLWCYDKFDYLHPRCRLQLHFMIMIMVYTGVRPGTIIESSCYPGSNSGLTYGDFRVYGIPAPTGGIELVLEMRLRFVKRNRQTEEEKEEDNTALERDPDITSKKYIYITFREDRELRARCPVTAFLGLACADEAFVGLPSSDLVHRIRSTGGRSSIPLDIKPSKKDIPIFRKVHSNGEISATKIIRYSWLRKALKELGERAGFRERLRAYNIRRGVANAIDANFEVTPSQYEQLLGHSVRTLGAHYVSTTSGIDSQGIINGQTVRHDYIALLRSMSMHLDHKVPQHLSFKENQEVLENPELQDLLRRKNAILQRINKNFSTLYASKGSELYTLYCNACIQYKSCYRGLYDKSRTITRARHFRTSGIEDLRRQIECESSEEEEKHISTSSLELVSASYFPDRFLIADKLLMPAKNPGLPDKELLIAIQNICRPDKFIMYYPGELPTDQGDCLSCKIPLEEMNHLQRVEHVHDCVRKKKQDICSTDFQQSCPDLCKWSGCRRKTISSPKQNYLPANFGSELDDPEKRKRARAIESKRLHDLRRRAVKLGTQQLSQKELEPSNATLKAIAQHLRRHITASELKCRWDKCNIQTHSEFDLRRHLQQVHHVSVRHAPFSPQYCVEHPELGWFTSEFEWEDHCSSHIINLNIVCDIRRSFSLKIGYLTCPFCLGNTSLPSAKRACRFLERCSFNVHMNAHFRDTQNAREFSCPHPLCNAEHNHGNIDGLKSHLLDVHHLKSQGYSRSHGYKKKLSDINSDSEATDNSCDSEVWEGFSSDESDSD